MALKKRLVLLILVFILLLVSIYADEDDLESIQTGGSGIGENKPETVRENIQTQIETSLRQSSTLDLSQPLFRENEDEVRFILLDEYNVDINNIVGAKISGGRLTLPGGSSFELKTGKLLSINAAGASINSFSDGSMVVVNAIGVNYDGTNLKVDRGEKVKYGDTEANNFRNFAGEQGIVSFISADLIVKEGNVLNKVKAVDMRTTGASSLFNFICAEDRHQTIAGVQLACSPNKRIKADIGVKRKKFTLDKDVTFKYNNIEGKADENEAVIDIKQLEPDTEEIITTLTTIKITTNTIQQTIIAKTETRFKRDTNEGVYELSLGTESRFSHQEQDETKSFFVLNTGTAPYTFFINTPSHQLAKDAALVLYQGFADPINALFAFTGIVSFGGYENLLPYNFFESTNRANTITLEQTRLSLDSSCADDGTLFSLHTGPYDILEVCTNGQSERYADVGERDAADRLTAYTTADAEITFTDSLQQKKNGKYFTLYPESSWTIFLAALQKYEDSFAQCSPLESFITDKSLLEVMSE